MRHGGYLEEWVLEEERIEEFRKRVGMIMLWAGVLVVGERKKKNLMCSAAIVEKQENRREREETVLQ